MYKPFVDRFAVWGLTGSELQKQIDSYITRVEQLVAKVLSGPEGLEEVAKALGGQLVIPSPGFRCTQNFRAQVARGVAQAIMPSNWDWDVLEMMDGTYHLIVTLVHPH